MDSPKFLGVYSGNFEASSSAKDTQRKQYWYVWYMVREHRYIISNLDAQQKIPASFITPLQFGVNLVEEKEVKVPEPECPDQTVMQFYSRNKVELKANQTSSASNVTMHLKSSDNEKKEDEQPFTQVKNADVPKETKSASANNKTVSPLEGKSVVEVDNTPIRVSTLEGPPLRDDYDPEKVDEKAQGELTKAQANLLASSHASKDSKDLRRENAKALRIDKDIRQDLANAIEFWKKGKKGVASVKIDALLKRKDDYVKAHKHTFTECAIQLRKINQNEAALAFAIRCTEVAPEDSHTFFNAARMSFELKNYKQALDFVQKAIKLQPDLEPAHKLSTAISGILGKMSKKAVL